MIPFQSDTAQCTTVLRVWSKCTDFPAAAAEILNADLRGKGVRFFDVKTNMTSYRLEFPWFLTYSQGFQTF